jgi:peptidoglycan-associated lipoprotein
MRQTLVVALLPLLVLAACKKDKPTAAPVEPAPAPMAAPAAPKAVPTEVLDEVRGNFARVYFDTDSSDLNDDSKAALTDNVTLLKAHSGILVEIEGHADDRGTTDYNLALGQRRAAAVRDFLVARGVTAAQLRTVSYGEERPVAQGAGESVWSKNRRAEFRVVDAAGAPVGGTY